MHGFIFSEIQSYVSTNLGPETWKALLAKADLGGKVYQKFLEYPDEEAVAIVGTASEMTGNSVPAILEDFGRFLGPHLLKVFRPLIDPDWGTLEFLENTEETIHKVVRSRNKQAKPPSLVFERLGPDELLLTYRSARKMCPLAKGIARGVADDYGDTLELDEEACMHQGAQACKIRMRRVSTAAAEEGGAPSG